MSARRIKDEVEQVIEVFTSDREAVSVMAEDGSIVSRSLTDFLLMSLLKQNLYMAEMLEAYLANLGPMYGKLGFIGDRLNSIDSKTSRYR